MKNWCDKKDYDSVTKTYTSGPFQGLIVKPLESDYTTYPSKIYLMDNDKDIAKMYNEDYFDETKVNLKVESCM